MVKKEEEKKSIVLDNTKYEYGLASIILHPKSLLLC